MPEIVNNPNRSFVGECRTCLTTFKESISVISQDIAMGEHSLFAHIVCPVCKNLTAVYPEEVFEKMKKE